MRWLTQVALIVFVILCVSPNVHAVPTFTWTEPWSVTLFPNSPPFCQSCGRAFGASATQDGQILNTTLDAAVAKSFVSSGGPDDESGGSTGLSFSRHLMLTGSPSGWAVSLNGY